MDITVLERALEREKARRKQAETLLESKSRELYLSYEKLRESHEQLELTNRSLQDKQQQFLESQEQYLELNSRHNTITHDLQLAASLQEQILPDAKHYGQYEVRGLSKPAMYVAGDIYDWFRLTDSVMAFYIADVTGHGPAAAMISYSIHKQLNPKSGGLCATQYLKHENIADAVVSTVASLNNDYAGLNGDSHFFTLIYGLLNFETGEVRFSQAGHPAPIKCSQSKEQPHEIGNGGIPVGMFKDMVYTSNELTLNKGDSLFLYSDGITECFSPDNEEYGKQRLNDVIHSTRNSSLFMTLKSVDESITDWNNRSVFSDDVSIFAIKRS